MGAHALMFKTYGLQTLASGFAFVDFYYGVSSMAQQDLMIFLHFTQSMMSRRVSFQSFWRGVAMAVQARYMYT
jgi:hypothetical protein